LIDGEAYPIFVRPKRELRPERQPAETQPMLQPRALDHVGLIVTDMDRSLRFYQALGLELLRRSERGTGSSAVLKVGAQEINLFCRADLLPALLDDPQRIEHFCLMMESATIEDLVAALREAGLDIASGPRKRRDGAAVFLNDPNGVRVELQIRGA
jgi:catechol 2,3-dioxygenase-like lactoylglutathione lyase family enzyme